MIVEINNKQYNDISRSINVRRVIRKFKINKIIKLNDSRNK